MRLPVRVLLADSSVTSGLMISSYLEELGCNITLVQQGEKALNAVTINSYDFILLDHDLTGLSGYQVAKRFRQDHGETPIILFTQRDISKLPDDSHSICFVIPKQPHRILEMINLLHEAKNQLIGP